MAIEWMSVSQASEILGRSRTTIRQWLKSKRMMGFQIDKDAMWMIPKAEVDRIAAGLESHAIYDFSKEI